MAVSKASDDEIARLDARVEKLESALRLELARLISLADYHRKKGRDDSADEVQDRVDALKRALSDPQICNCGLSMQRNGDDLCICRTGPAGAFDEVPPTVSNPLKRCPVCHYMPGDCHCFDAGKTA